jgi:hypothetical protein
MMPALGAPSASRLRLITVPFLSSFTGSMILTVDHLSVRFSRAQRAASGLPRARRITSSSFRVCLEHGVTFHLRAGRKTALDRRARVLLH